MKQFNMIIGDDLLVDFPSIENTMLLVMKGMKDATRLPYKEGNIGFLSSEHTLPVKRYKMRGRVIYETDKFPLPGYDCAKIEIESLHKDLIDIVTDHPDKFEFVVSDLDYNKEPFGEGHSQSGFDVMSRLKDIKVPKVIFTSSDNEYDLRKLAEFKEKGLIRYAAAPGMSDLSLDKGELLGRIIAEHYMNIQIDKGE